MSASRRCSYSGVGGVCEIKVNQGEKGLSVDEVAVDVLKLIYDMGSTER